MSLLQELLNLGLVNIGEEDSRFEKIKAAAAAMKEKLNEDPSLLIPATLIALDKDVEEDDSTFVLVEKLLIEEWQTLKNTHTSRPRELLRSIIIDTIFNTVADNPEAAGVVWFTAVSPFNHDQARLGKEASLVTELIQNSGIKAEQTAIERARMIEPAAKKRQRKKNSAVEYSLKIEAEITAEEVIKDIGRTAGPHDAQNLAFSEPNPHWPNAGPPWSHEFAPRMASALAKAVNLSAKRLTSSISKNLATYLETADLRLSNQEQQSEAIRNEIAESQQASRMRLDVLWWSEALYSPTLRRGYREIPLETASIAMALDLTKIVPALAPASVTYMLGEAVRTLSQHSAEEVAKPLEIHLATLAESNVDFAQDVLVSTDSQTRQPLIEMITEAVRGTKISAKKIRLRTGVDPSMQISSSDLAKWMFCDLQARRLVEELR